MKNKLLFLSILFVLHGGLQAQEYDIDISIGLTPPYPTNLDAYAQYFEQEIFAITNNTMSDVEAYFEISLVEESGKLSIQSDRVNSDPLTLSPGTTLLSPEQIEQIFAGTMEDDFQTTGLSDAERQAIYQSRQLPEGNYSLCIIAYDLFNNPISDPSDLGCSFFPIIFDERPIIISPFDGETIFDTESGNLQITWTQSLTDPESTLNTEYRVKILDLTEMGGENVDPTLAMLNPTFFPAYESEVDNTTFLNVYSPDDLDLIFEHKYAIRVTAYDPNGQIAYQDGGHSEVVVFTYGDREILVNPDGGEVGNIPPPTLLSPLDNQLYESAENTINLTWEHELPEGQEDLLFEYRYYVVDMTDKEIQAVDYDMFNLSNLYTGGDMDAEEFVVEGLEDTPFEDEHDYAICIRAINSNPEVKLENGGLSEINVVTFSEPDKAEDPQLPAPVILSPEDDEHLSIEEPLTLTIKWEHEHGIEEENLLNSLVYNYHVIDVTDNNKNGYDYDTFDEDAIDEGELDATGDDLIHVVINDLFDGVYEVDHVYAMYISVETEDERKKFENDGKSKIIEFTFAEEEEDEHAETACGGDCLSELPDDQKVDPIKVGDNLIMGKHDITIDQVVVDPSGGQMGEGYVRLTLGKVTFKIEIEFSGLKANRDGVVFDGEAKAKFDENFIKMDGLVGFTAATQGVDYDLANNLANALGNSTRLVSGLFGRKMSLPIGLDKDINGQKVIIGISEMKFTPKDASLTTIFSMENPDWDFNPPAMVATDICFTRSGFGNVIKLGLAKDYEVPYANEQLKFIASEGNTADEKGTYCMVDCEGFVDGMLTMEIGLPREMLLPENEDGSIPVDGFATLGLSGKIKSPSQYILEASLSPCQLPGLEGFSLSVGKGSYDNDDDKNPDDMVFPAEYPRDAADKTWKGVYFSELFVSAPRDWGKAGKKDRTKVGIKHLVKDKTGLSIVGSAANLLSIEDGEYEGFAISVNEINLEIVQSEFKNVSIEGNLGLPILPEDKYLDYEGIVSVPEEEDTPQNANNPSGKEILFSVKPDEEGYDMDYIKSHIDFDENSEFVMKNNAKQRGFAATLSGSITFKSNVSDYVNNSRDGGTPEVEVPGIKFEGMEISRMIDKEAPSNPNVQQNTGKNANGGFVFERPTLSFMGKKFLNSGPDLPTQDDSENDEEEEEEEDSPAKMNGFSIAINDLQLKLGEDDEESEEADDEEEKEIKDGMQIGLYADVSVKLVGGQNKKKAKDKKDKGFAISANGKFKVLATAVVTSEKKTFEYQDIQMEAFAIEGQVGPLEVEGGLAFYNGDETFGNGMEGNLKVTTPLVTVDLDARYGNAPTKVNPKESYPYWYLFGDVGSKDDFKKPLVKVGQYFSIYGFNGGAYYQMRDLGALYNTPAERYTPDEDVAFGLKAGLTFSVTEPNVFWANPTFGIEVEKEGDFAITLDGSGYMMQAEPQEMENADLEGVKVELAAKLNVKQVEENTDITFDADMKMYAAVGRNAVTNKPLLSGNKDKNDPNLVVDSKMHISKEKWSVIMGTPSVPGSVQIGIPDIATIDATAYLMAGEHVPFEEAKVDTFIQRLLLNPTSEDFKGDQSDGSENTRNGDGFAFGTKIDYNLNIQSSILYAKFRAMFGFDLSMVNYGGATTCANLNDEALGIGGYYAKGQIFAGLEGQVGLDIDCFLYTGKVELAYLYAVMLIQGGAPNPVWVRGQAAMGYRVLGGAIQGNVDFDVSLGEQCEKNTGNPFVGITLMSDIDPGENQKNVSVFAKPRLSFANRISYGSKEEVYEVPTDTGIKYFKVELDKFILKDKSGKTLDASLKLNNGGISADLELKEALQPNEKYKLDAELTIYEKVNGVWKEHVGKDNKPVSESLKDAGLSGDFTSGDRPDYIVQKNVSFIFPLDDQRFYLQGENKDRNGVLELFQNQADVLDPFQPTGQQWWTKPVVNYYEKNSGIKVHSSDLQVKNAAKTLYSYTTPTILKNSYRYTIKYEIEWYQNPNWSLTSSELTNVSVGEGITYVRQGRTYSNYESVKPESRTIFSYDFRTSKYNRIHQKLGGKPEESSWAAETYPITASYEKSSNGSYYLRYDFPGKEEFSVQDISQIYYAASNTFRGKGLIEVTEFYNSEGWDRLFEFWEACVFTKKWLKKEYNIDMASFKFNTHQYKKWRDPERPRLGILKEASNEFYKPSLTKGSSATSFTSGVPRLFYTEDLQKLVQYLYLLNAMLINKDDTDWLKKQTIEYVNKIPYWIEQFEGGRPISNSVYYPYTLELSYFTPWINGDKLVLNQQFSTRFEAK